MLARLAENLFWAGRYVERAEDTARMIDVTYHTMLESPTGDAGRSWEQLLEVLHVRDAYTEDPIADRVMRYLVVDRDNPSSITAAMSRARENVRSVRELVSSELWESVNELHLALTSRDLARELADQPYTLFGAVRRACMTIYGVASETMPRDEGWRFMALGRLLERAEMTCRLIDVRYAHLEASGIPASNHGDGDDALPRGADRTDFHQWVAVLKSASAFEAYRRRYRASMDPVDVVEFLLLEADLPRSVLFCLVGAMHQLEEISGDGGGRAVRRLGRSVAGLKYRDVAELFELGLHDFLDGVQEDVARVAEAIADDFFRHHPGGTLRAVAT